MRYADGEDCRLIGSGSYAYETDASVVSAISADHAVVAIATNTKLEFFNAVSGETLRTIEQAQQGATCQSPAAHKMYRRYNLHGV